MRRVESPQIQDTEPEILTVAEARKLFRANEKLDQGNYSLLDGIYCDLLRKRSMIMDRDPLFTKALRRLLKACGVHPVRYRPGEPLMNIYAERFVKSIKHECLDGLIFVGEASIRKMVREYPTHYNEERTKQAAPFSWKLSIFPSRFCI